jgi:sigma-B regulation protein RsbU (phosphoserine phosphatase)
MKDDLSSEYEDLKEYYLTDERKERLKSMSGFKKFFVIPWWILKSLYFKLTPFRRLLLIAGIILLIISSRFEAESPGVSVNYQVTAIIGGLIFLFIIALELKDKLHAKTELEEGRAVQKALMPEVHPQVAGWDIWLYTNPANDVGGDLLDYLKISDNKVGVSVGDVAGKGLSAALLMAKLQSTIRAIVPDCKSLAELGEKLNKIFCRDSLPRLFASLVYLELDTDTGKIKLLNAGHLPPSIIRNEKIERLKITSPALGLITGAMFSEQTVNLHPEEFIIIYSDGLTEARSEKGEFFGEKRVEKLLLGVSNLSSKNAGERILRIVSNFIGKAKSHDDLTIAILKKIS